MIKKLRNDVLGKTFPSAVEILLKMKLTLCIILFSFLGSVASETYSQTTRISLDLKNAKVKDVLGTIENKSEFFFLYSEKLIDVNREVNVEAQPSTIEKILDKIFEGTDVTYTVKNRQIVLTTPEANNAVGTSSVVQQQGKKVTGKVTDQSGASVPGASIVVKGTTMGVVTDLDGSYTLSNIPENATLQFSFVGMKMQEVSVGGKTTINVKLEEETIGIEEVIAVGYGTQKKANLTGSVASMQGNDLLKVVSTSTAQTLQGRMAGVQISQNSGSPGSGSSIVIRGQGSLKSNNAPLVVVDGFIGSLDDIAAGDIESISVLKDAASSAIYGSRAANGVVLVTTKRGKVGKMVIEVKADYGVQSLTKKPEFLNASEYAQKQNEERIYAKQLPYWTGDLAPDKLGQGTDWYGYIFDNKTPIQNYYVGLRGGTEATKYSVSLGYIDQQGIILGSNYNRTNLRTNFDHQFSKKIHLGINLDLKRGNSFDETGMGINNGVFGLNASVMTTGPTVPITFPDGSPGIFLPSRPGERSVNGMLTPNIMRGSNANTGQNFDARASVFLEIELLKGLSFKSVFNKAISYSTNKYWVPTYSYYSPENTTSPAINNPLASLVNSWGSGDTWELQELLTYKYSYKNHNLALLAGFSSEEGHSNGIYGNKTTFPNNELQVMNAGSITTKLQGWTGETALTSLFGQLNYDYKGKYLFQADVRRDGSSVFAPGHQFGVFPSASIAWRVSEESFLKRIKQISNLKLRGGYGTLGNAGIPQYAWTSTYQLTDAYPFGSYPQTFNPAYYVTNMTNPNITWESTTSLDFGLDLGLFANRFNLVADYYDKNTSDMLLDATIPALSGYSAGPVVNLGKVQNKGWEISASWDDKVGDFRYGVSFNLSHNDNKVLDMGGIATLINGGKIVKEGLPLNSFWGYQTDGIFKTWDEVNTYPHFAGDFRPGEYKIVDVSGPNGVPDGIITTADKVFLGDRNPKYYYGATLNAEWKGVDISLIFSGEAQKKAIYENGYGTGPGFGTDIGLGQTTKYWYDNRAILDASGNVVSGTTPVMGTRFNDANYYSTGNIYDVSFFRIKNIQIGYTLPKRWMDQLKMGSARVYFNAVNPILFTKYMGADPETTYDVTDTGRASSGRGAYQYYPVTKTYSIGISLKF